jgi:hypothetical protein
MYVGKEPKQLQIFDLKQVTHIRVNQRVSNMSYMMNFNINYFGNHRFPIFVSR